MWRNKDSKWKEKKKEKNNLEINKLQLKAGNGSEFENLASKKLAGQQSTALATTKCLRNGSLWRTSCYFVCVLCTA